MLVMMQKQEQLDLDWYELAINKFNNIILNGDIFMVSPFFMSTIGIDSGDVRLRNFRAEDYPRKSGIKECNFFVFDFFSFQH